MFHLIKLLLKLLLLNQILKILFLLIYHQVFLIVLLMWYFHNLWNNLLCHLLLNQSLILQNIFHILILFIHFIPFSFNFKMSICFPIFIIKVIFKQVFLPLPLLFHFLLLFLLLRLHQLPLQLLPLFQTHHLPQLTLQILIYFNLVH